MAQRVFRTVPAELIECAEKAVSHFENVGFKTHIEKSEIGFPYTPTILCSRSRTTIIVEVHNSINLEKVKDWVAYAKSSGKDTRFALCLCIGAKLTQEQEENLRNLGVGLYFDSGTSFTERLAPNDLALNVELPKLSKLSKKLRQLLGTAYEQFQQRTFWREGFESACQAFESEARRYLKKACRKRKIRFVTKKGLKTHTNKEIDRLTMGQLAAAFEKIDKPNHPDSIIGSTLKRINKDRVGVAHHKSKMGTEKRLRQNVGQHMWAIVAAMKESTKV